MKYRNGLRAAAFAAVLAVQGCRDATAPEALTPDNGPEGFGARTVASYECSGEISAREVVCRPSVPPKRTGSSRTILGLNQVKIASSNVSYDTVSLVFGFDMTLQNLLAEPIGTSDGSTVTGAKVFYHTGPMVTSYYVQGDTGSIVVRNPDGVANFTGPRQPFHLYAQVLSPGQASTPKRWEWAVPRTVRTFSFTLKVFSVTPSEPKVPPVTPDTFPVSLYAPSNVASDLAGLTGTYLRDIVTVLFYPGTPLEERQAAIDQVGGLVVGGERTDH